MFNGIRASDFVFYHKHHPDSIPPFQAYFYHTHSTMSSSKPITLYTGHPGPNPFKVVLILQELGLSYEEHTIAQKDLHTPVYEKVRLGITVTPRSWS